MVLRAYNLQDSGLDTIQANEKLGLPIDNRDYKICIKILTYLGVKNIKLMTNNPCKLGAFSNWQGEEITRVPLITEANRYNKHYLNTKKQKLGHLL